MSPPVLMLREYLKVVCKTEIPQGFTSNLASSTPLFGSPLQQGTDKTVTGPNPPRPAIKKPDNTPENSPESPQTA